MTREETIFFRYELRTNASQEKQQWF